MRFELGRIGLKLRSICCQTLVKLPCCAWRRPVLAKLPVANRTRGIRPAQTCLERCHFIVFYSLLSRKNVSRKMPGRTLETASESVPRRGVRAKWSNSSSTLPEPVASSCFLGLASSAASRIWIVIGRPLWEGTFSSSR
jgi:hypothetical protein